jgi:hypothetical protein
MKHLARILLTASLGVLTASAQYKAVNPQVSKIVSEVSEQHIVETLKKLEGFGTRNLRSSQDDPNRGIGAARKWIYEQLRGYSPRLEVSYDHYRVKKDTSRGSRIPQDVDLYNVVAVLPGAVNKDRRIIVSAHYDSVNRTGTPPGPPGTPPSPVLDPNIDAPGVTDDGSGVACVMELARVMSRYQFEKTIVFIAFAGEEDGEVGSSLYAAKAKTLDQKIEAVLNNDIIGNSVDGDGRAENRAVNVFSEDPNDSPSREIARYVRTIGERYVPSMTVDTVFRADRFGRDGDQRSFTSEGFAAVRLSTPVENFANEHTAADTFAGSSPGLITSITQVNGAAVASLAWAPKSPQTSQTAEHDGRKLTALLLSRGKSRYDALLQWKNPGPEPDLAGYVVVMRKTTAPDWEREIYVGNVTEYRMPGVSVDQFVFGVAAVDKDGNESLVAPYVPSPHPRRPIATY